MRRDAYTRIATGMIGLALTLAGCGGQTSKATTATLAPTATATLAPTATPSPPGAWATLTGCGDSTPAAVRVQYQESAGYSFQRSDNCGATWANLSLPQIPGASYSSNVTYMSYFASPVNPSTVYITLQVKNDTQLCPAQVCQPQYVSTDGGATWAQLKLPVPGYLDSLSASQAASGARLYGVVTDAIIMVGDSGKQGPAPVSTRLVVSIDGGVHWTACDGPLVAQGLRIAMYAAPPSGPDLYVIAAPKNDTSATPPLSVWSSHDGGSTWSSGGPTPGTGEGSQGGAVLEMFAGVNTASGRSIIYLDVMKQDKPHAMASVDGGHTWLGNDRLIFTADNAGYFPALIGTLPDGSVLVEFPMGDGPTTSWKPGSALRTVAQNPNFRDFYHPLVVSTSAGVFLWLSGDKGANAVSSVEYTQLQL